MERAEKLNTFLKPKRGVDISAATMEQRMRKSPAEIALIKHGANVADVGGYAIRDAVRVGATELEVAMAGRDAMEREIAKRFPDCRIPRHLGLVPVGAEYRWRAQPGDEPQASARDILSLNCFPMISGYYTALERTMFVGEVDDASLRVWETNIAAHEYGMSLLKPVASCSGRHGAAERVPGRTPDAAVPHLRLRAFLRVLSHYYGREAGLELREDIDTVLEPGMVISMEPMLTIADGEPGAGGYREHDILVITEDGAEDITHYPYGPAFNVVG